MNAAITKVKKGRHLNSIEMVTKPEVQSDGHSSCSSATSVDAISDIGNFDITDNRGMVSWLLTNNTSKNITSTESTELNAKMSPEEILPTSVIVKDDIQSKLISSETSTYDINNFPSLEEDPFHLMDSHESLALEFDAELILKSPQQIIHSENSSISTDMLSSTESNSEQPVKKNKSSTVVRVPPPAINDTKAIQNGKKRGKKRAFKSTFIEITPKPDGVKRENSKLSSITGLSDTQAGLLKHLESANSALLLQKQSVNGHESSGKKDKPTDPSLQSLIRKQKLERNRESARECRRRKREHILGVEERCRQLERENMELRSQLHAGKEAMKQEEREKTRVCEELEKMIQRGASEKELAEKIDNFKEQYSDYGHGRRSALNYHLHQIERLLLPTQVTKMCIWALRQDDSFWQDEEDETSLPVILAKELGLSDEQKNKIQQQRGSITTICENLKSALTLLDNLKRQVETKNSTLDYEMDNLQSILTPTQRAKFIVWVTNNPACMHLLNKLWRTVL